jgi:hypothetical protein
MQRIERYRALCADGRALDEQTTLTDIHHRRWKPSTIVRLEWDCGGTPIEISHVYGLMAQLLPDRSAVAIPRASLRSRFAPALEVIEPDGQTRFTLVSPIRIEDREVHGEFAWFESPHDTRGRVVRTVFWSSAGDRYFLLDVDTATGGVTAVMPLQ